VARLKRWTRRYPVAILVGLCALLLGCSGVPEATPTAARITMGPAAPTGTIKTQATSAPTRAASQATAAQPAPSASESTATPKPTPTIVPAVAGLVTDGATKGAAGAKVTITEFTNPL